MTKILGGTLKRLAPFFFNLASGSDKIRLHDTPRRRFQELLLQHDRRKCFDDFSPFI